MADGCGPRRGYLVVVCLDLRHFCMGVSGDVLRFLFITKPTHAGLYQIFTAVISFLVTFELVN